MLGCLPRYFMLVTARGKDENPKLSDVIKYANIAIINKPLEIEEVGDHIISAQTNEDTIRYERKCRLTQILVSVWISFSFEMGHR